MCRLCVRRASKNRIKPDLCILTDGPVVQDSLFRGLTHHGQLSPRTQLPNGSSGHCVAVIHSPDDTSVQKGCMQSHVHDVVLNKPYWQPVPLDGISHLNVIATLLTSSSVTVVACISRRHLLRVGLLSSCSFSTPLAVAATTIADAAVTTKRSGFMDSPAACNVMTENCR